MTVRRSVLLLCVLCASTAASADPVLTEFSEPGPRATTIPTAINKAGTVAGYYNSRRTTYAFLRSPDGTLTSFSASQNTAALAINERGYIVGYDWNNAYTTSEGFIRLLDGVGIGIDGPGLYSVARAINAKGVIAGDFRDDTGLFSRGFIRARHPNIVSFDAPGAGTGTGSEQGTHVSAINASGDVVGTLQDAGNVYHGYIRAADGSFTAIDAPGAGTGANTGTYAISINASGAVAGYMLDGQFVTHGFIRAADGTFTAIEVEGATAVAPAAINDRGVVTGYCAFAGNAFRAFVRSPSGHVTLFSAPDAGSGPGQGTLATAINQRGVIVGYYRDAGGQAHGFVRTP